VTEPRPRSPAAVEAGTIAADSGEAAARGPAACRAAVLATPGFAPRDEIVAIRSAACCGVGIRMCPCCTFRFSVLFQWFLHSSKDASSTPAWCLQQTLCLRNTFPEQRHDFTTYQDNHACLLRQPYTAPRQASNCCRCPLSLRRLGHVRAHLMLLSVRPGSICAIWAHLLGCWPCSASRSRSSSRDHGSWLMPGSRWLHQLTNSHN